MKGKVFGSTVATVVAISSVAAQDAPLTDATPDVLVERLAPKMVVRGINPVPNSVDLAVGFEFNSATLTNEAKQLLSNLAVAMKHESLNPEAFVIIGHTDGVGSQDYNQPLSKLRAEAVRDYLVSEQGIETPRLETIGRGKLDLLFPDEPNDGRNRRVEIKLAN